LLYFPYVNSSLHFWIGPRGLGKSEKARDFFKDWGGTVLHRNADLLSPPDGIWLKSCFRESRDIAALDRPVLLVLDEVRRIAGWEGIVREELRNEGGRASVQVLVISSSAPSSEILGPSSFFAPLHFQEGRERFGLTLEEYLYFGGLPTALERLGRKVRDVAAWRNFVAHSHIETILGRDISARVPVTKPVLLRQVLQAGLRHAGEVISINRFLDELPEKSRAKTVVGYLKLLEEAHLIRILEKFSGSSCEKSTIPCFIALDNVFVTATSEKSFEEWVGDDESRKRLAKNAVGARLLAVTRGTGFELFHWKDREKEVDFVLSDGKETIAVELKLGWEQRDRGLKAFLSRFPGSCFLSIGPAEGPSGRIALARFLGLSWEDILQNKVLKERSHGDHDRHVAFRVACDSDRVF
jgi:hypothetical protein